MKFGLSNRSTQTRAEQLRTGLLERLGTNARIISDESHRRIFSRDLADIPSLIERALFCTTPSIIVQPRNTQEIAAVLKFANEHNIPIFPRGVASSAFGGPVPTSEGIVLDLSPLMKIERPSPRRTSRGITNPARACRGRGVGDYHR